MTTATLEIHKRNRGWGCLNTVQYPDWPRPVHTNSGYDTLKHALWSEVLDCDNHGVMLVAVSVNGKDMPLAEVCRRVEKALSGGVLAYHLPAVRKMLAQG